MKGSWGVVLAAAVLALLSGCGTVCNLASGDPDNYGGVQRDLKVAADMTAKGGIMPQGNSDGWGALAILGLFGADVCLSFVGDTLTLPLASYLRQKHEAASRDRPTGPDTLPGQTSGKAPGSSQAE